MNECQLIARVSKMSASLLVYCVGVATRLRLCPIAKETVEAAATLCTVYGPNLLLLLWSPQFRKDIDAMERVQRRAPRLIPGLARLSYEERLKETGLYTLERRWLRGDMMEMFKIMKGTDKISADELFNRVDQEP